MGKKTQSINKNTKKTKTSKTRKSKSSITKNNNTKTSKTRKSKSRITKNNNTKTSKTRKSKKQYIIVPKNKIYTIPQKNDYNMKGGFMIALLGIGAIFGVSSVAGYMIYKNSTSTNEQNITDYTSSLGTFNDNLLLDSSSSSSNNINTIIPPKYNNNPNDLNLNNTINTYEKENYATLFKTHNETLTANKHPEVLSIQGDPPNVFSPPNGNVPEHQPARTTSLVTTPSPVPAHQPAQTPLPPTSPRSGDSTTAAVAISSMPLEDDHQQDVSVSVAISQLSNT